MSNKLNGNFKYFLFVLLQALREAHKSERPEECMKVRNYLFSLGFDKRQIDKSRT